MPRTLAKFDCTGGSCPAVYADAPGLSPDDAAIVGAVPSSPALAAWLADRTDDGEVASVISLALLAEAMRPADEPIGPDELMAELSSPQFGAWRIETFQDYIGTGRDDEWVALMEASRRFTPRRTYSRTHVVTEQLSPAMVEELTDGYGPSADAGENISIIAVPEGEWPEGIPRGRDFWLLDSSRMLVMNYAPDMTFTGAVRVTDPVRVVEACRIRDAAMAVAVPWRTYVASRPELRRRLAQ
jgi:hypothetical protein